MFKCVLLCVLFYETIMKTDNTAVTGIILEKRKSNSDGLHPVKLRVTFNKERKYYIMKGLDKKSLYMTLGDFAEIQMGKEKAAKEKISKEEPKKILSKKEIKLLKLHLGPLEKRAIDVIKQMSFFTFAEFEEKYFDKPKDSQDVFAALDTKAKALRKDGKISTAITYECTLNSLKDYTKKEKYPFGNITVKFLKEYEKLMLSRIIEKKEKKTKKPKQGEEAKPAAPKTPRHISKTTVSIYLRCLRAIFNESAPVGIVYPFGKGKYVIPKWNHNKRALTQGDVAKIAGYLPINGTMEHRSRDLWLFSFLCNGINFKDLANLKYSNIKGQTIVFERAKTEESSNDNGEITVVITRQIGRIIDRWGVGSGYIFDIQKEGMTAEEQHRTIQQTIANTNKYMKRICAGLEIPKATTYTARHSFATVLKRSGASVEYISESLGHKNIRTTQNYLADFEIEEKKKWAEKMENSLLPEAEE